MTQEGDLVKEQKGHIAIIDDEPEMRSMLGDYFNDLGFQTSRFPLASDALKAVSYGEPGDFDVFISDIHMPEMDGMTFVSKLKELRPKIPVILITAFGSIENAISAIRNGAYDYIVKPFKLSDVSLTINRAIEYSHIQSENSILRNEIKKSWSMDGLIGKSAAMKEVFDLIRRVAQTNANVLITGESGTGKEMVARAVHFGGIRSNKPFIAINCTAIPETLLESELFGHAKGAFTGAIYRKLGLLEDANGGTIFLDEIGDMSASLQAKLLRVIQERKIKPVGDNAYRNIDVRIITATHKDLKAAIKDNLFREDLYYRLSVIPIALPPLRHRKEDIPLFADYFLKKYSAANGSQVRGFTTTALKKLMNAHYNGNVRELENMIERAVVLSQGTLINEAEIPDAEITPPEEFFQTATADYPTVETLEKRYIKLILEKTSGRKDKAAGILGMNRRTLYRKEREYGFVAVM